MGTSNDTARRSDCCQTRGVVRPKLPTAPTLSLLPLGRLSMYSTEQIRLGLQNLRNLYFPSPPTKANMIISPGLSIPKRNFQHHIHDASVPDSGYASAEDDDDEEITSPSDGDSDIETESDLLRADPLERSFAIKWVTGFISRSDSWVSAGVSDAESDERTEIFDEAIALLSAFTGRDDEDEVALTRTFTFPLGPELSVEKNGRNEIHIELNDAPLSKDDHTSVGLQSWGSCILFAERLCLQPSAFSLLPTPSLKPCRVLELGAGTGMLSIVAAKILQAQCIQAEVVATDYHPDVLNNLLVNVSTNFPSKSPSPSPILVDSLDWEHPTYFSPPFDSQFDIILAADVIYHPSHARWIKQVVEHLLNPHGVFWLFIPVRTTGRHEGMTETVDTLFSAMKLYEEDSDLEMSRKRLAIIHQEEVGRQGGIGRADEGAYKLFKIGWID